MDISKKGLDFIKKWEGFRSKPYFDVVGVATIGYGSTYYANGTKVNIKDPEISEADAEVLKLIVVDRFSKGVTKLVKKPLEQYQFDALVSFSYNLGLGSLGKSTLLKKVNIDPCDSTLPFEFMKWNKAGGRVFKGLSRRRAEEANIYWNGYK
jgi:lysozyme